MKRVVIKDTIMELWRGNISYVILTIMAIGLIQSISATYAFKEIQWVKSIEIINVKKYAYMGSLFLFSFIWKGIVISVLGSFAFSKYSFSDKLSFLYLPLKRSTYLALRALGFVLFISIFFIVWNITLTLSTIPLKTLSTIEVLIFSVIGDLLFFLFLSVPLFFGLHLPPISASFASLILFFIGTAHLLLTPFVNLQISPRLEKLLTQFPNVISLVMYFPARYFNVPLGLYDLYPSLKSLALYLMQFIAFLVLFILGQKNIEL
ncbi:MAG: hypothetical protein ABIL39_02815 [candidate division WOR-3 bacterium]